MSQQDSEGDLVLCDRQGPVVTLSFNRPEKRNALNPEMLEEFASTLTGFRDDPDVRCVILRGVGEDAFSAGFDIGRIGQDQPQPGGNDPVARDPFTRPKDAISMFPRPVIAMIHGYCLGGGLEIAVACDLRIASDSAHLGMTPARLGIVYGYDPIREFVNLVGPAFTRELFYVGRAMDAQDAYLIGLVNHVVPKEQLEEFTYALAEQIADNAPLSVAGAKTTINHILTGKAVTEKEQAMFAQMRRAAASSEDLKEGRRAFLEKRKPQFKGR